MHAYEVLDREEQKATGLPPPITSIPPPCICSSPPMQSVPLCQSLPPPTALLQSSPPLCQSIPLPTILRLHLYLILLLVHYHLHHCHHHHYHQHYSPPHIMLWLHLRPSPLSSAASQSPLLIPPPSIIPAQAPALQTCCKFNSKSIIYGKSKTVIV